MKIIKGPDPITCENCGCQFEYDKDDVIVNDVEMRDGAFIGILPLSKHCNSIRCPICNHKIILEWKRL